MADNKFKEITTSSELIYKGKIIDVYKDQVICPNGHKSTRELIRHCKASCILAITNDNKVVCTICNKIQHDNKSSRFNINIR